MIDIHNHILPGVDDGAANLDESLEMARIAVKEGISTIIATPHHANGRFDNKASEVSQSVRRLNDVLAEHQIPLEVLAGQEIRVYDHLLEDFHANKLLSLHNSSYMLIEFPSSRIPDHTLDLFHELEILGIRPVIAHPERNAEIVENPNKLYDLVLKGALSQVTSHSLNGVFGTKIQSVALQLCKRNLVHFIASDAHHPVRRPFRLADAYQVIDEKLGPDYSGYYINNARNVIESHDIQAWEPLINKKKWYQMWK